MRRALRTLVDVSVPDPSWPYFAEDEIAAVATVLRSGKVNQWTNPIVREFEQACDDLFGGGHGVAVANGTLALELALRAFNIGAGDEVVVTPRSFVASASCVRLLGATPIFADVDPSSGNITAATIERVLSTRTRAIIPVHLAGWPADMPAIMALADAHGMKVIEDCAQAHGARIAEQSVGSFGHAAAFSFCQDKIVSTAGEGGYASFQDRNTWRWARSFKDHGKNFEKALGPAPATAPGFRWLHDALGTNWRLTAPQAAVGLAQLKKLPVWTSARTRNAMIWARALAGAAGIRLPMPAADVTHAYYRFSFYVDADDCERRDCILAAAAQAGLRVFSGPCGEIYREQAFDDLADSDLPIARQLAATSLQVEVHPTLDPDIVARRAELLRRVVDATA